MYCSSHFEESRREVMHALIAARPLATLVTMTTDGLNADHIPLVLSPTGGAFGALHGHIARANPMWKTAQTSVEALAIFHGPASYISPSWYPTKRVTGKAVPTWNYVVVHARGILRLIDDPEWLRRQVGTMTAQQERGLADPWQVSDAPADYIDKMLAAIVGVELVISRLDGKWKTSQNQPAENRMGAAAGLRETGTDEAAAMAALLEAQRR